MPAQVGYEIRYAAFLDILGFRGLIDESADSASDVEVADVLRVIDWHPPVAKGMVLLGDIGDIADSAHRKTHFSDSIAISAARTPQGLLYLVHHIELIAFELLKLGRICRGGVARGALYHDGDRVFGPVMLDAYDLESQHAIYPRVILSKDIVAEIGTWSGPKRVVMNRMTQDCADGWRMIHPVLIALRAVEPAAARGSSWHRLLSGIRGKFQKQLGSARATDPCRHAKRPRVSASKKLEWILEYLDNVMRPYES